MIIGLTGGYGAGKDTVAKYFVEKGFNYISLSDFLREECKSENIEITRDNLIKKGNELRKLYGPWILGKMAKDIINPEKNYVIVSIRNPGEVKELKKFKNFFLVNVVAPKELRYKRLVKRGREDDEGCSFEDFLEKEGKELSNKNKEKQQLMEVYSMAHIILDNKYSTEKQLFKVLDKLHIDLKSRLH